MYLVKAGVPQWEVMERIFTQCPYPTRALAENMADLNAALAALQTGEDALKRLAKTHGNAKVKRYMAALKDMAAQALDEALQSIPSADCEAEERLDDGSRFPVRIRIREGGMEIDFSGASPVHPGNLNANISIVYSVVLYVLRLLVKKDIPLNEGLLRRVRIHLPEGSLLHPRFEDDGARCPAVAGGNTELSQRLTDTLLKALGLAACSQGTMNNFLFGNAKFGYYETIGGGSGAGPGFAGRSAVHQHMTNTRITDPEELELRYPVRLLRFAIRRGSGGQGRWPGGEGIIREFEFLEAVEITLLTQHRNVPPYGMAGGQPGMTGGQYLLRPPDAGEPLQGTDNRKLLPGDRVRIETPGGGGWGAELTAPKVGNYDSSAVN
jgi:5-oxoprolinase (ATP-hydrolysing)